MAGGRPRKPTRLKEIAGTLRADRSTPGEPMPKRGKPKCPPWLDLVAKAKWKALAAELDRLGMLTIVDGDSLACYCQAWAEFEQATRELQGENGRYTTNAAGTMVSHPAVAQQRSAWRAILDFSSRFGLDPSSRTKLSVPEQAEEEIFVRDRSKDFA